MTVFLYKPSDAGCHCHNSPVITFVMDENILGKTIIIFLADQHGHAIDNIDEHIVLQHHGRNGIAQFKLNLLVDAEAERQ